MVLDSAVQIILKPTFLDAMSARGKIHLDVLPNEDPGSSTLIAQFTPASFTKEGIYLIRSVLLLWALVAFAISFGLKTLMIVFLGLVTFIAVIHLTQVLNQGKLQSFLNVHLDRISSIKHDNFA